MISRRKFLAGMALTAAAAVTPTMSLASVLPTDLYSDANGAPLPDYDERALKGRPEEEPRYCEGVLNLKSGHTGERYRFEFRDTLGNYDLEMLGALNYFLRCPADGLYVEMDTRVIELVNYVAKFFPGNPEVTIHSGYRSPAYNALLRRGSENVAKNSLHMYGKAVDFSIKGVPIRQVCQIALAARNSNGYGGVGFYPKQGFIHMDSGDRSASWVR